MKFTRNDIVKLDLVSTKGENHENGMSKTKWQMAFGRFKNCTTFTASHVSRSPTEGALMLCQVMAPN